jgi:hypothetical protein
LKSLTVSCVKVAISINVSLEGWLLTIVSAKKKVPNFVVTMFNPPIMTKSFSHANYFQ